MSNINTLQDTSDHKEDGVKLLLRLPITDDILSQLQSQDVFCLHIITQLKKSNLMDGQPYKLSNKLLMRNVSDNDKIYETVVVPRALTAQILKMAHDDLGHNGTHRTYMLLKRLY